MNLEVKPEDTIADKVSIRKDKKKQVSPQPKLKKRKSSFFIRKLKLVKQASVSSTPSAENSSNVGERSASSQPSTSSERQTPEGDENELLIKSNSNTNLTEASWKSAENIAEDVGKSGTSIIKIESSQYHVEISSPETVQKQKERSKSLETFKGMPAYGDLILDTVAMSNQNQAKPRDHLYKILVIGDLGTGKTSIIKRYVHEFFSQHYRATIGVDFALKVINWDENTRIRLQLWDIAGQERYGNMTRVYYKEAVGAFIVFDVTRVNTFESVANWKTDLDSKVQLPDGSSIPCVLLANKCDQQKEGLVNNPTKMDEYCREKGFSAWFETSAKENINIDEAARALVGQILLNDKIINSSVYRDGDQFSLGTKNESSSGKLCSC